MGTYEGWKNYETWNVALWIDNDEPIYRESRDRAREIVEANITDGELDADAAAYELGQWVKDYTHDAAPDLGASCFSDLLQAALGEVDWTEIGEHIVADVKDDVIAEAKADAEAGA